MARVRSSGGTTAGGADKASLEIEMQNSLGATPELSAVPPYEPRSLNDLKDDAQKLGTKWPLVLVLVLFVTLGAACVGGIMSHNESLAVQHCKLEAAQHHSAGLEATLQQHIAELEAAQLQHSAELEAAQLQHSAELEAAQLQHSAELKAAQLQHSAGLEAALLQRPPRHVRWQGTGAGAVQQECGPTNVCQPGLWCGDGQCAESCEDTPLRAGTRVTRTRGLCDYSSCEIDWLFTKGAPEPTGDCVVETEGPANAKFNKFMQVWPFMQRYTSAYSNIFELQQRLNQLNGGGVVGNVGYFGKQVSTYVMVASEKKSICETGFGSGHSAVIYLSASSDSSVITFDLGAERDNIRGAKQVGLDFINEQFTERHTVVWGDAKKTIIEHGRANPDFTCDLVVIDGDHSAQGQYEEIVAFQQFVKPGTALLNDVDYGGLQRAMDEGILNCDFKWKETYDPSHTRKYDPKAVSEEQMGCSGCDQTKGSSGISWELCAFKTQLPRAELEAATAELDALQATHCGQSLTHCSLTELEALQARSSEGANQAAELKGLVAELREKLLRGAPAAQQQHSISQLELREDSVCQKLPMRSTAYQPTCEEYCRKLTHDDMHPQRLAVAALVGANADAEFVNQIDWCQEHECAPARGCSVELEGNKVHIFYSPQAHVQLRDDSMTILCEPGAETSAESGLFWDNLANNASITCLPELDALLSKWVPSSNSTNDRIVHLSNYMYHGTPLNPITHLDNFIGKQWCERQLMIGNQNFIMVVEPSSSLSTFSISAAAQGPCAGHVLVLRNWPREVDFCKKRDSSGAMDAWLVTEVIKRKVSVLVSNVDVVWFKVFCAVAPGLQTIDWRLLQNFSPGYLDTDYANQLYSASSLDSFTKSLEAGNLCGNGADGVHCSHLGENLCLEGIFNFGFYFVRSSNAALNIQLHLAKGVLARRVVDEPGWEDTPSIVGRPLCHDNNEFNLMMASQQQQLVKQIRVAEHTSPVRCAQTYGTPEDLYPGKYKKNPHALPTATIRAWEIEVAPTSVNFWLDDMNVSKIVGAHMTMLWGIDKVFNILEMLDENKRAMFTSESLPRPWREPSRKYISYAWWTSLDTTSFEGTMVELGKAVVLAARLGRHLILPRFHCSQTLRKDVVAKSMKWCTWFTNALGFGPLQSSTPGLLELMPSTFLLYDLASSIIDNCVLVTDAVSTAGTATHTHLYASAQAGSLTGTIKNVLTTNCTSAKPCSIETFEQQIAQHSDTRLVQLSSMDLIDVGSPMRIPQFFQKSRGEAMRQSASVNDGGDGSWLRNPKFRFVPTD